MKPYNSLKLFENPFLEKFTHVHPVVPFVIWVPIILLLLWRSFAVHDLEVSKVLALGLFGFLAWTFTEYTLHRFLFHFKPRGPFGRRMVFLFHGIHHEQPDDPTRLVMPPIVSITLGIITFSLFKFLLGDVYVEPFYAIFIVGYLSYDFIHFSVHHFTPRTAFGRFLKQNHMLHHFVTPEARWGVSSSIWDHVFRTTDQEKRK